MSVVTISLDIESREVVLAINGVLVPQNGCNLGYYINEENGKEVYFSYTVKNIDDSGITEIRQFRLPSPEEAAVANSELDDNGLSSNVVDDEKKKTELIEFLELQRKSR